jgi:hypothetical protein
MTILDLCLLEQQVKALEKLTGVSSSLQIEKGFKWFQSKDSEGSFYSASGDHIGSTEGETEAYRDSHIVVVELASGRWTHTSVLFICDEVEPLF